LRNGRGMREDAVAELRRIVGDLFVLTERSHVEGYLLDETAPPTRPEPAEDVVVVKPKNAHEVSEILKLANRERIPVFPRGAGTGLVGGCIPTVSGIVLSTERMDEIEVDEDNLMAVVGAGAKFGDFLKAVEQRGFHFPPHPGDEGATMGGFVTTNAGGARAVKHGVMRHHVKGLEVVLPTGEVLSFGGKLLKDNTKYDLMHLVINSEGTLGVVTKATLRIYPKPKASASLIVPFNERGSALEAVPRILRSGIIPLAIEYFERDLIEESARHLSMEWPCREGAVYLYIISAGLSEEEVLSELEKVDEVCRGSGSLEALLAESREEQERILKIRSNIYTALKPHVYDILDVAVPPARLGRLMDRVDEIAREYEMEMPACGHAGDGNLHAHIMKEGTKWCPVRERPPGYQDAVMRKVCEEAVRLGGTLTGEHGLGKVKWKYLLPYLSERELELMRAIRKAFDPNGIMNPGTKIF